MIVKTLSVLGVCTVCMAGAIYVDALVTNAIIKELGLIPAILYVMM
jgi:hypothetical protein